MRIYKEQDLWAFEFWCGAADTAKKITQADRWEELEEILREMYPHGIDETELNDLFWFEPETIFNWLDIDDGEEEEI